MPAAIFPDLHRAVEVAALTARIQLYLAVLPALKGTRRRQVSAQLSDAIEFRDELMRPMRPVELDTLMGILKTV